MSKRITLTSFDQKILIGVLKRAKNDLSGFQGDAVVIAGNAYIDALIERVTSHEALLSNNGLEVDKSTAAISSGDTN